MSELKSNEKEINVKLTLLRLADNKTQRILEKGKLRDIQRHKAIFDDQIDEITKLKVKTMELKIKAEEDVSEIEQWETEMDETIATFENVTEKLEEAISDINSREQKLSEEQRFARLFEEERKIQQMKLEVEKENAVEHQQKPLPTSMHAKLPKLKITQFNGTHSDWLRFWSQFEVEIDKSSLPAVTKLSYLKEMLIPRVQASINGLPFTTEGYERAKNILQTKYGQSSEVINAHIQQIFQLPVIYGSSPGKIHNFYNNLVTNVQALETLKRLNDISGNVRMVLDKLPGIRADLVRDDKDWQNWKFPELVESIRQWTVRNPITSERKYEKPHSEKMYQSRNVKNKCVFCDKDHHKPTNCNEVTDIVKRREIIVGKKLCFNCLKGDHQARSCPSKWKCFKCSRNHHTSLCQDSKSIEKANDKMMTARGEQAVTYPVVIVKVNGIKCRALIDTGAGSTYASSNLINNLEVHANRIEKRSIEMLMYTATRKVRIYKLEIENLEGTYSINADVTMVDKSVLLTVPNPNYEKQIKSYNHLNSVRMNETDTKPELPIHIILGTAEVTKIKTKTMPLIGAPGDPIAEYTKFGWIIMSPGNDTSYQSLFQVKSTIDDYEQLCRLDVLGIEDHPEGDQHAVYQNFKEQLRKTEDNHYETGLLWKMNHPPLKSNKEVSLGRLKHLLRRMKREPDTFKEYHEIIQDQLDQGVIEEVPNAEVEENQKVFYIPHKPVIRPEAETTKLRIVYDASAREDENSASLNDCLETGPSLQNLLWNIIVRNRVMPVTICGDLKKAFWQVKIREEDRNALRFHWVNNPEEQMIKTYRFTRALFGLNQSPFLLGGTIEQHLENYKEENLELVNEILRCLYVDDVIHGGVNTEKVWRFKQQVMKIFKDAQFILHKWHSNEKSLEANNDQETNDDTITFAKNKLGTCDGETKILGLKWDKNEDTLAVKIKKLSPARSKRGILKTLASIYDPIGLISPVTLIGKQIYRDICKTKVSWDKEIEDEQLQKWSAYCEKLPEETVVQRSITRWYEEINFIDLHVFSDASKEGCCAAIYAVINQDSGYSQGLLASKARLSKQDTTIPRLELIACHMATNLMENTKNALQGLPIRNQIGWTDSSVALHWLRGEGNYRQFVKNRVMKIQAKSDMKWRHVPGNENPADVGSRGAHANKITDLWWNGPQWLLDESKWPKDITTVPTIETEAECKAVQQVLAVAVPVNHIIDSLIKKYQFTAVVRIIAWTKRFIDNSRKKKVYRNFGPLITSEIQASIQVVIQHVQTANEITEEFERDKEKLRLEKDGFGIYVCKGRIQGVYPIYVPPKTELARSLIMKAHIETLHGGVGLTMTKVRDIYWIPKLRQLTKSVIKGCFGCKRFYSLSHKPPATADLPIERTVGHRPFQVIGIDFAGPITYRKPNKKEGKAYIIVFSCSLSRALYLELLPDQTLECFIQCLKRFIARRGRPEKIYSDNFSTFVAAWAWLRKIFKEEKFHEFLAEHTIQWKFNLSRAPWWGGQFERMVSIVKQSLYKTMGKSLLRWNELEEVILDIEITLNNRPLGYIEDDIEMPILTPNSLMYDQVYSLPEDEAENIDDIDLRKRARYLKKCKEAVWSRWSNEYLKELRSRHNIIKGNDLKLKIGDVVIIKGDERNRAKWKLGIVEEFITGRDGVVRGAKLRAGRSYLERAIQHLYPLELHCDRRKKEAAVEIQETKTRPIRNAAAIARLHMQDQAEDEENI